MPVVLPTGHIGCVLCYIPHGDSSDSSGGCVLCYVLSALWTPGWKDGALCWLCLLACPGCGVVSVYVVVVEWRRFILKSLRKNPFSSVRLLDRDVCHLFTSVRGTGARCLRPVRSVQFIQFSSQTLPTLVCFIMSRRAVLEHGWGQRCIAVGQSPIVIRCAVFPDFPGPNIGYDVTDKGLRRHSGELTVSAEVTPAIKNGQQLG